MKYDIVTTIANYYIWLEDDCLAMPLYVQAVDLSDNDLGPCWHVHHTGDALMTMGEGDTLREALSNFLNELRHDYRELHEKIDAEMSAEDRLRYAALKSILRSPTAYLVDWWPRDAFDPDSSPDGMFS